MYARNAFFVLVGVAGCVGMGIATRDEIALDLHHQQAIGRVIHVKNTGGRPHKVQVSYLADGRQVKAWVRQPSLDREAEINDELPIEYLPSEPKVARHAGTHDPLGFFLPLGLLALIVVGSVRAHRRWSRQPPASEATD